MFTLLLFIFISSITVVSAVDVSGNVTSADNQVSTVNTMSVDQQQVDENNNIESNVNEIQDISNDKSVRSVNSGNTRTINNESYSTYFTNGVLNNAAQDGDVILIDDIFEGSSFIFDKSINLTSTQNGILRNCIITFNSNADYSNVTNLNIVNIDDNANDGINVYSATNMTIEDNTIYIDSNNTANGITLNNADGSIIYNNTITVNAYTNEVTYYYEANYTNPAGTIETAGIGVYNSSYTNVESNTVSMSSTGYHPQRGTLVGIAVQGNIVTDSDLSLYPVEVSYNTIQNNIVNLDGDLYAYGITLHYFATNNTIINNTITADSSTKFYVCGIQLSYYVLENQIYDNKINLTALNFTYGINSQGLPLTIGYNDYYNNRINLSAIYTRGIESFNGYYDNIRNNVILTDGDYSNGIGLGGINGNNITNNLINSNGTIFTVYKYIYDDIPFKTDGIYVNSSRYYDNNGKLKTNLARYNNISNNYILTNGVYAIDLYCFNSNITNNYITSSSYSGNSAVNNNNPYGNNNCNFNYAYTSPTFLNQISISKSNKLQSNLLKSRNLKDNEVTTHVITPDNWKTYFIMKGLTRRCLNSSLVSDNDVLDLQGEISLDYYTIIDKAVNITSTTNNGKISSEGNVFEINNTGSHSNLTNICLYNTQLILNGADYINIDHINVSTENYAGLGWGKGVTSIREGCDYINVTNSYFYVYNNGGSSNFVLAGSGFVNVDNNTFHSEGMVGNVVYLNFYNVENQTNQFINITNNNITGPTDPAQICWLIGVRSGNDVLIKGNNLTYTGEGIMCGVPNLRIEGNNLNNVTNILLWTDAEIINNTGIHNIDITGQVLITGNEINGDIFRLYCGKDSIISNNNIKINSSAYYDNIINCDKFVFENNTYDSIGSLNINGAHGSIIQNNTITSTADYSINLTNSSANTIINNTLIASNLTGDRSVYGPGDYVENNTPTKGITEYTVCNPDELQMVERKINTGECETDEIVIYFEDFDFYNLSPSSFSTPNKKVTIDGSRMGVLNLPNHFIDVGERTTLIIKNFKIDTILYDGMINNGFYDNGYSSQGNITFENCFINFINMTEEETPDPINTFVHSDGTGYISFKSCTIIDNIDCYTALTSGNEVYIVDSIILGSDIKLYNADNKPETLEIRQNYINSYDKTKYPDVKDEVVAMVNGIADSNTVQVTGDDKVVLKWVVNSENGYDNLTHQFGYEDGVLLGSINEEVINTTGLIFNKSNNYTITLDENPVDETVTLYTYVLYDNKTDIILLDILPEEICEEWGLIPEDYTPGTTIDEKKLMDIVEYIATEETIININLSTLTHDADNNIIINITDVDGNLIETSGSINVSINGEESATYDFNNGELTIPYKIMSPDNITIFAAYGGSDQYRKSNTTAIFTPEIILTEVLTNVLNNTYGNVTVEVSVKAEDDFVEDGIITVDGIEYNITGETTIIPVSVDITGANVTVVYMGDEIYNKSSTIVEIIPDKRDVTISPEMTDDTIGTATLVVGIVDMITQEANATGNVTVTVEGNDYVGTIDNGVVIVDLSDLAVGSYSADINYKGDTYYNEETISFDIEIKRRNTTVTLDDIEAYSGDNITLKATVTDDLGNLIKGGKVVFKVNGKTVGTTTVSNGVATLNTTAIKSWVDKEVTVFAKYAGGSNYLSSNDTAVITVSLKTAVVDTLTEGNFNPGDTISLFAMVTGSDGKVVNSGYVLFKLNGITIKDENGNNLQVNVTNGIASSKYTLTNSISAREYTLTAVFIEGNYNRVEDNSTITVNKGLLHVQVDAIIINSGEPAVLTGKIYDSTNNLVTRNVKVSVKINGLSFIASQTASKGIINFTLNQSANNKTSIDKLKDNVVYNVLVIVSENTKYLGTETNTKFVKI